MHALITKAIPLQNSLQPWIIDATSSLFGVVVLVVYFLLVCLFVVCFFVCCFSFICLTIDVAILLEGYIVNLVCLALNQYCESVL